MAISHPLEGDDRKCWFSKTMVRTVLKDETGTFHQIRKSNFLSASVCGILISADQLGFNNSGKCKEFFNLRTFSIHLARAEIGSQPSLGTFKTSFTPKATILDQYFSTHWCRCTVTFIYLVSSASYSHFYTVSPFISLPLISKAACAFGVHMAAPFINPLIRFLVTGKDDDRVFPWFTDYKTGLGPSHKGVKRLSTEKRSSHSTGDESTAAELKPTVSKFVNSITRDPIKQNKRESRFKVDGTDKSVLVTDRILICATSKSDPKSNVLDRLTIGTPHG
ncbi:hypothetical protein J6590_005439 [Homalodisca vitripennis]|nr:hypothetical protein J6590_005439 [Homalodisca vitripennis]